MPKSTDISYVESSDGKIVPVPNGYTASKIEGETSVNGGFVIYEGIINWDKMNLESLTDTSNTTSEEILELQSNYNQYVWVPVKEEELKTIYGVDSDGKLWGKLYSYCQEGKIPQDWSMLKDKISVKTSSNYFEPGLGYGVNLSIVNEITLETELNKTREELNTELEQNYYNTIKSIQTYGGFYIGRYETGMEGNKAVIRKMNENIAKQSWAEMYQKTQEIKGDKNNVTTSMIWSSLWDYTMQWLINTGAKDDEEIHFSETWGNYSHYASEASKKIPAGSLENTKSNNIYDMAGNVNELTLGCYGHDFCHRGGSYLSQSEEEISCASRGYQGITDKTEDTGSRAILLLKNLEIENSFKIETESKIQPKNGLAEWIKGVRGYCWNTIQSITTNNHGQVVVVGSISEYSPDIAGDFYDGVDLNSDGTVDEIAKGNKDGIIIGYDENGTYLWSKTFGGKEEDSCNQIISTKDGGYLVTGYTASPIVYFNEKLVTDLSQANYELKNKDGYLLKLNSEGDYEWGIRIGGILEDEIIKAIETTTGDLAIIGNFTSTTFHFYENNSSTNSVKILANEGEQSSFLAMYSAEGKYKWSQKIGGNAYCEITDITEIEENLTVTINYKGKITIEENESFSSYLADYQDGMILSFSSNGNLNWQYEIYSAPTNLYSDYKLVRLTSLTTTKDNTIAVAMECTNVIKNKKTKEDDQIIYTCQSEGIIANVFLLSSQGEFIKNLYDLSAAMGTLSANSATVVFQDIISTTDNDILLGGYYYSEKNIDVDKDGSTSGEYDFKSAAKYHANGFVIQIDLEGNVNFSDCIYRTNREIYAPSNITCVNEINGKKIIAGGNFYWETATTKNFYQNNSEEEKYITRIGNTDGFVFFENREKNTSEPIYELPITGANDILFIDFISVILICLGILKFKKNF